MPEPKPLPKNRRIEQELEAWCRKAPVNSALPAETALAEAHGASVMLVRQSLARLEARGIIHKVQGRGNFVAPRAKNKLLLLVHHDGDPQAHPHVSALAFALSKAWAATEEGGPLITLGAGEVSAMDPGAWRHAFPHLAGVIFFREVDPIEQVLKWSLPPGVTCLFLGSSAHRARVKIPGRYHDEGRISRMVAKALAGRNVAVVGPGPGSPASRVHLERVGALMKATHARHHVDPHGQAWSAVIEEIQKIRPRITGLACAHDPLAAAAIQWAVRIGLSVPKDLAVVGVNGDPAGEFVDPPLTTVRLDLKADADALVAHVTGKPLDTVGSLNLKKGESA